MEMDFEKMMQMIEMMKLFTPPQEPQTDGAKQRKSKTGYESMSFYDQDIHTSDLKSLKAAIPFVDYRYQKSLGIMVKLIEIQRLLEMYSHQMNNSEAQSENWRREMLLAIRPHIDENRRNMVDLLIKYIDVRQILNKMEVQNAGKS